MSTADGSIGATHIAPFPAPGPAAAEPAGPHDEPTVALRDVFAALDDGDWRRTDHSPGQPRPTFLAFWAIAAGAVAVAALAGLITDHTAVRAALGIVIGLVIAASVIAAALIVRSDVDSRAAVDVARYAARAEVSRTVLRAWLPGTVHGERASNTRAGVDGDGGLDEGLSPGLLAALTAHRTAVLPRSGGSFVEVNGIRFMDERLQLHRMDGQWIDVDDVLQFRPV